MRIAEIPNVKNQGRRRRATASLPETTTSQAGLYFEWNPRLTGQPLFGGLAGNATTLHGPDFSDRGHQE